MEVTLVTAVIASHLHTSVNRGVPDAVNLEVFCTYANAGQQSNH
jgi:hypothetical protein